MSTGRHAEQQYEERYPELVLDKARPDCVCFVIMPRRLPSSSLPLLPAILLVAACPTPASSDVPAAPTTAEPAGTTVEPIVETPPPVEPASSEPREEIWRFTTLVTGGPESLIGANGYYELVLVGDQASVRKTGERGTPQLPAERVMEGSGPLALVEDPMWPSARSGTLTVTLANESSKIRMSLSVWLLGDELHGSWIHPDNKLEEWMIGRAWGLLEGKRDSAPTQLDDGERTPCWICNEAYWNCEGAGTGGCNSSNSAIDECDERVGAAKNGSADVPRGCGG